MAKRYDIKGKTYFKYPNKYYYTDIGVVTDRTSCIVLSYIQANTSNVSVKPWHIEVNHFKTPKGYGLRSRHGTLD